MRILRLLVLYLPLILGGELIAKPQHLDGIAAIVNDGIITKSELSQQVTLIKRQIQQSGTSLPDSLLLEKQVLDQLILEEIQRQLARKTGIQINELALDEAIENIARQNHLTLSQLKDALVQEGVEFTRYRANIRRQLEVHQLQQRDVLNLVHVSEQEVSQFLQSPNGLGAMAHEYRLAHILVSLPEAPSPEQIEQAAQKAKKISSQLRAGEDFFQLAVTESNGEQALQGGDLGWRKLPELPTIFEKIVGTLKVNEISSPIRTSNGFHIVKLLDKRIVSQANSVEKTLARHILIKTNTTTSDGEAEKQLRALRKKILAGEDFTQLAKIHSADLASAHQGGSIGWVSAEVLVPEFSQKMANLQINEISQPFKSPFGWHIVQVLDRQTQSEDEATLHHKAKEMLQQRKYQEKLQAWTRQIQDEAYIKKYYEG